MDPIQDPKMWYTSKTLWINILAIVAMVVQLKTGYVISPELQTAILVIVNLILRQITNQPIVWTKAKFDAMKAKAVANK